MVLPAGLRWSYLVRSSVFFLFFCFGWSQSPWQKTVSELLQTGRLPEARKILLELAQEDPDNEDLQAILGQIAFSLKEYGEAAKRFQESTSKLSTNPILLLNYTESLLRTKANRSALEAVERLPENHFMAQFEAGLILARFGEFPAAERHFRLARAGHPDPLSVAYNLALAQYRLRKFEECAATLEEMRRGWTISNSSDPPDHSSAQKRERMLDLLLLAKKEAPVDVLRQAIDRDPGNAINYLAAAERLVEGDKLLQAVGLVERGLEQLPQSYSLRFKHAHLRYFLAQYGMAEAEYRKAAELRPDLDMPRVGLALVLMETRQLDEASTVLQEVLQRTPLSFYGHYLLGELAILSGVAPGSRIESKAVEHLKQATALQPDFFFLGGIVSRGPCAHQPGEAVFEKKRSRLGRPGVGKSGSTGPGSDSGLLPALDCLSKVGEQGKRTPDVGPGPPPQPTKAPTRRQGIVESSASEDPPGNRPSPWLELFRKLPHRPRSGGRERRFPNRRTPV